MNSKEFYQKYHGVLACQLFADANNLPFAIAAIQAKLPDGKTVGHVMRAHADNGDSECKGIMDAYAAIDGWEDFPATRTFLERWNAFRKDRLPSIVVKMDKEAVPA